MAVNFVELEGSPRLRVAADGATATRIGLVAWADVDAFLAEQMGPTGGPVGLATFPGRPWLAVESIDVEPFDPANPGAPDGSGVATYAAGAKVTLLYRTPRFNVQDEPGSNGDDPDVPLGTLLTHRVGLGLHVQPLPNAMLVWGTDLMPVPDEVRASLAIPIDEHTLTWHFVPRPPWTALRDLRGKINSLAFLGYPPETVLFTGADAQRETTSQGDRAWTISYHFQARATPKQIAGGFAGWNALLRPDPGPGNEPWQDVIHVQNPAQRLYATGDFAALFVLEDP